MMTKRKLFGIAVALLAIILLLLCFLLHENGGEDNLSGDEVSLQTIETPYDYPVREGTTEWSALQSIDDKIEACQIPEEVLRRLSTAALIETVREYPLGVNLFAYDTVEMGYEKVKAQFNGLAELEKRVKNDEGSARQLLAEVTGTVSQKGENAAFRDQFLGTVKHCIEKQI